MSGITGIFYRDNRKVDVVVLEDMLDAIRFRGPDTQKVWHDGPVGLGQCQLQTLPESLQDSLPLKNTRDDLVITADARIDNRDDLVSGLGLKNRRLESTSDNELILMAYDTWGERCVERLVGDFAFVIWDKQKQQIYCAVDHFRKKPLCYYLAGDIFIFASQPSGLLPGRLFPKKINDTKIGMLFFEEIAELDKVSSCLENVFYIPPASFMLVSKNSVSITEYWNVNFIQDFEFADPEEYTEQFAGIFEAAVRCRLRSKRDPVVALSGGIDSTSITAVAKTLLSADGKKMITISGDAGTGTESIESGYVHQAISALSDQSVQFTPGSVKEDLETYKYITRLLDMPSVLQNFFLLCLFNCARKNNIDVLLTGAEGDTVLGLGNHYISHLIRDFRWITASREAFLSARNTGDHGMACLDILQRGFRNAFIPNLVRRFLSRTRQRINYRDLLVDAAINRDYANRIQLSDRLTQAREKIGFGILGSVNDMRRWTLNRPFITWMPVSMDMMSSAFQIDARHPFQDLRLIQFCLGLPWEQKSRDGWEKWMLRNAMKQKIPESIRLRKQRDHVGWEYGEAFCKLVLPEIQEICTRKEHRVFEYYDHGTMREITGRYRTDPQADDSHKLILLYGLYHWLENKVSSSLY